MLTRALWFLWWLMTLSVMICARILQETDVNKTGWRFDGMSPFPILKMELMFVYFQPSGTHQLLKLCQTVIEIHLYNTIQPCDLKSMEDWTPQTQYTLIVLMGPYVKAPLTPPLLQTLFNIAIVWREKNCLTNERSWTVKSCLTLCGVNKCIKLREKNQSIHFIDPGLEITLINSYRMATEAALTLTTKF